MTTKALFSAGAFFAAALAFTGCDTVDCPYEEGCDEATSNVIHFEDTFRVEPQDQHRVVLLEEFTGHTCTVCPQGAKEVERLLDEYGDKIIAVGIHAGTFAEPMTTGNKYTTDFRCSASETIFEFFDPPGNPMGMVSRRGPDGQKPLGMGGWEPEMTFSGILDETPVAVMSLNVLWDDSSRTVGAQSLFGWIGTPEPGNYRVQFYLVESHIVDWQLDDGFDDEDYEHNHVLRAGMNGDWGTDVTITDVNTAELFEAQIQLDDSWVKDNCEVVAFVYKTDTYEVFQAVHGHLPQ